MVLSSIEKVMSKKMHAKILENNKQIKELCDQYKVKSLELFGSAARGDFDSSNSDIDLLVLFENSALKDYADNYFGLKNDLQNLFSSSVDLVVTSSIKNPNFLESIQADRQSL